MILLATTDGPGFGGAAIFVIALAGILNFLIGLPISLDAYNYLRRHRKLTYRSALKVANLASGFLLLLLAASMGIVAIALYGVPILIAANVWAICGWRWVARPQLEGRRDG